MAFLCRHILDIIFQQGRNWMREREESWSYSGQANVWEINAAFQLCILSLSFIYYACLAISITSFHTSPKDFSCISQIVETSSLITEKSSESLFIRTSFLWNPNYLQIKQRQHSFLVLSYPIMCLISKLLLDFHHKEGNVETVCIYNCKRWYVMLPSREEAGSPLQLFHQYHWLFSVRSPSFLRCHLRGISVKIKRLRLSLKSLQPRLLSHFQS